MTIVELLAALSISVLLVGSVLGTLVTSKHFYATNVMGQTLQRDANLLLTKILKGKTEPTGTFRLAEAETYTLTSISELHFTCTDGIERWYRLSSDGTQVIYHHPTSAGEQDEVIYTAPAGRTITLRFWMPAGSSFENIGIGIDVGLSQAVRGVTVTGSVTTMTNIRNHSS